MNNILFLIPPRKKVGIEKFSKANLPPLGALSLSNILAASGYTVAILDCPSIGMGWYRLEKYLRKNSFWIIGIIGQTCYSDNVEKAAGIIKAIDPDTVLLTGGPHYSYEYNDALQAGIDFVVRFEGERTILNLVKAIEAKSGFEKVNGIAYRSPDGKTTVNQSESIIENLNELPANRWDLLPMKRYSWWFKKPAGISFNASRGCGHNCKFCVLPSYWKKARSFDARRIFDEVKLLNKKYGISVFWFTDDDFLYDRDNFSTFCDLLIGSGIKISWFFQTRADNILNNQEMIIKSRKAGAFFVLIGAESPRSSVLESIHKGITPDQIEKAVRFMKSLGFMVWVSFIVGFPEDNEESVREVLDFALRVDGDIATFSPITPLPGTITWNDLKNKGIISKKDYHKLNMVDPVLATNNLSLGRLKRLIYGLYFRYYVNIRFLTRMFTEDRLKRKILRTLALQGAGFILFPWKLWPR